MSRLPDLNAEDLTDAQRRVYDEIAAGPRGSVRGPFVPLLHSPGIADHVQKLGAYIRYECKLPAMLREFAICITARHWGAQYEWHAHSRIAAEQGLDQGVIDAIAERRPPDLDDAALETVYAFCTETFQSHRVSDATYAAAMELLGAEQVVDLVGLMGYYSLIGMTLNTFQVAVPGGALPLKV